MTTEDIDDVQLGTVSTAAFLTLGITLTAKLLRRFKEPGWFFGGVSTSACPVDGTMLHVFRKKYRSNGRVYLYAACVCTECRSAVAPAELGLTTAGLGLEPRRQEPPATATTFPPGPADQDPPDATDEAGAADKAVPILGPAEGGVGDAVEDLGFQALLSECVSCLPTESLRQVLVARLGMNGNVQTIQDIAEGQKVPTERIRKLQRHALSTLGLMAREMPGSAPHRLALELGMSIPPRHLAIAERIYRVARHDAPRLAHNRATLWVQIAGGAPSCSRRIATMVAEQIKATSEWERAAGGGGGGKPESQTLQRWLSGAEWPSQPATSPPLADFGPRRAPIKNEVSGSVYLAKADRQVAYDSGVERQFLSLLDRSPEVKGFVEQPCAIPYDFEGSSTYYPDVLVEFNDGRLLLVEVKDITHLVDARNLSKYAAGRRFAHQRGWGWVVCTGGYRTLSGLARRDVEPRIVQAFASRLHHGPITAATLRDLRNETGCQYLDVLAVTLQQGWIMRHHPFSLSSEGSQRERTPLPGSQVPGG